MEYLDFTTELEELANRLNQVNGKWFPIHLDESVTDTPVWQVWREDDLSTVCEVYPWYYSNAERTAKYLSMVNPQNISEILAQKKYPDEQIRMLLDIASQAKHIQHDLLPSLEIAIYDYEVQFGDIPYNTSEQGDD